MNRIHLLPEQVANQIAAGEVVERPASVVKELVENAIDAEASRITVEIQGGGRNLVRVTDDGVGMSKDDALLCLERHATSKIRRAEDLAAISTMGFRGEALPSIASVSRFTLLTKEQGASNPEGTQVVVNGGKIVEVKAAGSAPGTTVEIRQLFFNLPARRKFLRSQETETAHIQHYLTLAALAYPEIAFTFVKDGRLVWQLPPTKSSADEQGRFAACRERLRALWGDGVKLVQVSFTSELTATDEEGRLGATPVHIWGFTGAPGVSRSTREDQHIFVNRRPVENRGLNYALLEGYHTALMKGRYPVCCLFLEISAAEVDVNIHPAKREVKFHQERDMQKFVTDAIRATLLKFHAVEPPTKFSSPADFSSAVEKNRPVGPPVLELTVSQPPTPVPETKELPNFPPTSKPAASWPTRLAPHAPLAPRTFEMPEPEHRPALPESHAKEAVPLLGVPLRVVGVLGRLYLVLESDRGLVLLDQHAAHERVLFEQMLERLEKPDVAPSQRLLLPETIELSARDAHFLRQNLHALTRLGVGLSEFGERTFLLDSLPPFIKVSEPRKFITELVDALKAIGQSVNILRLGEHMIAKTVCRHAVKANDPLTDNELERLLQDLRKCRMPYTCPHGRPTLIEMNYRELEKKFGRTA